MREAKIDPRSVKWERNFERRLYGRDDRLRYILADMAQGRRQGGGRGLQGVGRYRQGFRLDTETGVGIEQDWRRDQAADETRYSRAVWPANPNSYREPPVISNGPSIAIAVRRASLEGNPSGKRVVRWWSSSQDVEDVPR